MGYIKYTYVFLMWVACNVEGVLRVLDEVRPTGSKFRVINPTVLQFEFEVSINGDELSIDPP